MASNPSEEVLEEQERSQKALELLKLEIAAVFGEIEEVILRKLHDQFSAEEVLAGGTGLREIVLGYFRRITIEMYADLGPEAVETAFEGVYYQIAAQKLAPEGFATRCKPYHLHKKDALARRQFRLEAKEIAKRARRKERS